MRVDLCGGTRVDGRTGLVAGRLELLLAVLVLRGTAGIRRDEAVELLWPAAPPAALGRALDPLLSRLRRIVGPIEGRGLLRIVGAEGVRCDVGDGLTALAIARSLLAHDPARAQSQAELAAVTLGLPLLPNHDDPWSAGQRAVYAGHAGDALALVAEAGLRVGGPALQPAVRAAARLVGERPLREEAVALLMRVQVALGDTASALATYEALRVRLADDLGAVPGASLRERHRRLVAGSDTAPETSAANGDGDARPALPIALAREQRRRLVGRERELDLLSDALRRTTGPRLAVVEGATGSGKTRLVAEVAARAHARGATVLVGRCLTGATPAFAPVVEALRPLVLTGDPDALVRALGPLSGDLAALVPALYRRIPVADRPGAGSDPLTGRHRLFEAIAALLSVPAAGAGVVLVVDDLQWLDRSSTTLLAHLLQADDLGGLTVLATARPGGGDDVDPVGLLRTAAGGGATVTPAPLDLAAILEIVEAERPAVAAPDQRALAVHLLRRTEGSPLLVHASLVTGSALGDAEELAAAVRAALDWAGPETRGLVETLAASDDRTTLAVIAHACRATVTEAGDLADRAHTAGLIAPRPAVDVAGVMHDSVRRAVLGAMSETGRAALHARLAVAHQEVFAGDEDAVLAEIARHWAGADGRATAATAARYGERAARQALGALAYEQAADQARVAREQLESRAADDARRLALLMLEGDAHNRASALTQARTALGAALVLAQRLGEDALVARIALAHGGHRIAAAILDEELIAALETGLAVAPPDDVIHARLSGRLAAALFVGPVARRDRLARDGVAGARASGDPRALTETLLWQHVAETFRADPEARGVLIDEAAALAHAHGFPELALHARLLRFSDLLEAGALDAATAELARWAADADEAVVPYHQWAAAVCAPTLAMLHGDLRTARAALDRATRLAAPLGQDGVVVAAHAAHELVIGLWDGHADAVAGQLGAMLAEQPGVPAWESALALAEALSGRSAAARARVTRVVTGGLGRVVDPNRLTLASFLTQAAVAVGAEARVLEALHALLLPHAGRWVVQHYGGTVHGPVDVRLALLETALGRHEDAGRSLARADANLGTAAALMLALDREHASVRLLAARGDGAGARTAADGARHRAAGAGLMGWATLFDGAVVPSA